MQDFPDTSTNCFRQYSVYIFAVYIKRIETVENIDFKKGHMYDYWSKCF